LVGLARPTEALKRQQPKWNAFGSGGPNGIVPSSLMSLACGPMGWLPLNTSSLSVPSILRRLSLNGMIELGRKSP
jgi:hypothetical protein